MHCSAEVSAVLSLETVAVSTDAVPELLDAEVDEVGESSGGEDAWPYLTEISSVPVAVAVSIDVGTGIVDGRVDEVGELV